jgi:osmotically-inducible protein OsmY
MKNHRFSMVLAGLAVVGMIVGGCSRAASESETGRTATDVISDATTTASVKVALAFEPGVKATEINVDTDQGTVTLRGQVGTVAERRLATKVAEDVSGVTVVVNQIDVQQ